MSQKGLNAENNHSNEGRKTFLDVEREMAGIARTVIMYSDPRKKTDKFPHSEYNVEFTESEIKLTRKDDGMLLIIPKVNIFKCHHYTEVK